jgi:hypothetical protein
MQISIVGDVLRQFSYSIRKACMLTKPTIQRQQCLFAFCKSSIRKKKIVETVRRSERLREREKWTMEQQHSVVASRVDERWSV